MTRVAKAPVARPRSTLSSAVDIARQASWLVCAYRDPVWIVTDTNDHNKRAKIDFQYRLADGRLLIDAERLYTTVKEYAWWVRDSRYSRIDDAITHATMVNNLMNVAHALSLRNIWSFCQIQPFDIEQLIEECRFGADAVLHASERVEAYLKGSGETDKKERGPIGLRQQGTDTRGVRVGSSRVVRMDRERIMIACNLPSSAKRLPRVAALIAAIDRDNGVPREPSHRLSAKGLKPLSNLTTQALQRRLDPLEQLYAMRRRIVGDAIAFKPFPYGAARVAATKGVGTERTPIPPPALALHLLEHAARCVFRDGSSEVVPIEPTDILRTATACWIIIAAFTARRHEEIDDLRQGCLRGGEKCGWWLYVYIEKTLQRREWIPVPRLVARSVEVMSAISAAAQKRCGTDRLFQWLRPSGEPVRLNVGNHLDAFAREVGVPGHRHRDGSVDAWHWHAHQFRRFFAVLYFYRYEGATIEALSHYLRHFNLEMTKRYVTRDPEVAAVWNDVEWGYTSDVARSIVAGDRSVSGAAGDRLKKIAQRLVDTFRRKLLVASPERLAASLALVMRRQGMVLTPKPWVTCTCPRTHDAAVHAACRRGRPLDAKTVGPDFAHAGPSVCASCPHAMMEQTKLPFVNAELGHLVVANTSHVRADTMFGLLEKSKLVELHDALDFRYRRARPIARPADDGEKK